MAKCRLCLGDRKLLLGHFMPAALYPTSKTMLYATQEAAGVTPKEVRERLLCKECEGKFNKYGETEVLRWLAPGKTHEPLPLLAQLGPPLRTFDCRASKRSASSTTST